jgi:hypothetical protein
MRGGASLPHTHLGQIGFSRARRAVQQHAAPRLALTREELRVLDGQNYRLCENANIREGAGEAVAFFVSIALYCPR